MGCVFLCFGILYTMFSVIEYPADNEMKKALYPVPNAAFWGAGGGELRGTMSWYTVPTRKGQRARAIRFVSW